MSISIRPATPADAGWLVPMAPRLHDFGPPPWRERAVMDRAVQTVMTEALAHSGPEVSVLVAEDETGTPLGFLHAHEAIDFFTKERHGHVSDLVVASGAEGRGVGTLLMAAGEAWSRSRGHRLLTLNVFEKNDRARELYDRLGFAPEWSKRLKVLR